MNKNFTIILLFFISQLTSAQINFFQTGATWGYSTLEHPDSPFDPYRIWLQQITITCDTTINNVSYKKLHRHVKETDMPGAGGGSPNIVYYDYTRDYIRFDSLNNSVFYINDFNLSESLLYDFNQTVGDTIPYYLSPNVEIIDSIEYISLFGYTVKKYYILADTSTNGILVQQYIIEGIGGSNGLTLLEPYDVLVISAHNVTDLLCFQLGVNVYPSGSACDVFTGIDVKAKNDIPVSVFPNPFQKSFRFKFPSVEKNMTLKIFDVMGKEIYTKIITDQEEIKDFDESGLFFWKLMNDEKIEASGKLLHLEN